MTSETGHGPDLEAARAMVSEQAHCSLEHALALMRDCAIAPDEWLTPVAAEVLSGNVRFAHVACS